MKKRHHFRPVFHLKNFAAADGLIWVFDKTGKVVPFAQKPQNIAYEKDLYAIQGGPGDAQDAFEDWLAEHIDRPAAGPLRSVTRGENLSGQDRFRLAAYIAVQDLRTPSTRSLVFKRFAADRDDLWRRWKADPERLAREMSQDTGTLYASGELLKHLEAYEATPENAFWLGMIRSFATKAAELVSKMSWSLGLAPDGMSFITSDVGIAKGDGDRGILIPWAPGIGGRRNQWIMPLNPRCALILESAGDEVTGTLKGPWVEAVNERLKSDAVRWVYSRERPTAW